MCSRGFSAGLLWGSWSVFLEGFVSVVVHRSSLHFRYRALTVCADMAVSTPTLAGDPCLTYFSNGYTLT